MKRRFAWAKGPTPEERPKNQVLSQGKTMPCPWPRNPEDSARTPFFPNLRCRNREFSSSSRIPIRDTNIMSFKTLNLRGQSCIHEEWQTQIFVQEESRKRGWICAPSHHQNRIQSRLCVKRNRRKEILTNFMLRVVVRVVAPSLIMLPLHCVLVEMKREGSWSFFAFTLKLEGITLFRTSFLLLLSISFFTSYM